MIYELKCHCSDVTFCAGDLYFTPFTEKSKKPCKNFEYKMKLIEIIKFLIVKMLLSQQWVEDMEFPGKSKK